MHDFMGENPAIAHNERTWFWGLLAIAILLRTLSFDPYGMHHPDEVLQYIEPAYRLVSGEGIVTWEYRYGMRGWLLPWLLAGPMALGEAVGGSAFAGIVAARVAASAVGLIPVVAAWRLGRRTSPTHAIVAMAAMAFWYEQLVFSTHVLTETLATALFLGAAALIDERASRGRMIAGGALIALAAIFRFQYGLAAGIFVLLVLRNDWRRWSWLILGALPAAGISGAVDLAMGQWPFQWIWVNIQLNLIEGRASGYGVEAPAFFLQAIWGQWGLLTVPILLLAIMTGRTYRPLLFAALFNLAAHSLIGHKEYRFVELSMAAIILLAAIGSVNGWRWIERRWGRSFAAAPALIALVLIWAAASAWLGRGRPLDRWFGERSVGPELAQLAGRDPRVCGIGTMTFEYWQLSRAYIGRDMPILLLDQVREPEANLKPPGRELASINAVIASSRSGPLLPGYSAVRCKGPEPYRRCLFTRPGGCQATPEADDKAIERVMLKYDI
jgi:hypothetical protein